jgi:hypothetical protein
MDNQLILVIVCVGCVTLFLISCLGCCCYYYNYKLEVLESKYILHIQKNDKRNDIQFQNLTDAESGVE